MKKTAVACPKCGALPGASCTRVNGTNRVQTHQERLRAASEALGGPSIPKSRKNAVVKRFGAFLRLYGPKDAPTHAVLVLGRPDLPDTPRAFQAELDAQYQVEHHGKVHGIGTEWRLHLDGQPRMKPPTFAVRVLNTIWQHGASRPPWLCAGLKQLAPLQAREVAHKLGQTAYECEHCGRHHLKGRRHAN